LVYKRSKFQHWIKTGLCGSYHAFLNTGSSLASESDAFGWLR